MSPEPPEAQAPLAPELGVSGTKWAHIAGRFLLGAFVLAAAAVEVTVVWLMPDCYPGPSPWGVGAFAVSGAIGFLGGHAVLALRVIATEPTGRHQMVQAAIELMLAGAVWLSGAGLMALIIPFGRCDPMMSLPAWLRTIDLSVTGFWGAIAWLWAMDGFLTAVRIVCGEWNRPPSPSTTVPSFRSRLPVDQN